MRAVLFGGLISALAAVAGGGLSAVAQAPKEPAITPARDTPAADLTRTKLLKVKVSATFTETRLGNVLKELSHLVETQTDGRVMWAYGANFPFDKRVTFSVKDKPLEVALDQLLTKAGAGLGYFVVSRDGDRYDGWVKLTTTGERGFEPPPPTAAEEADAAEKLALAKKLIDTGKAASARPVLEIVVRRYPATKAGVEANELLGKLEK